VGKSNRKTKGVSKIIPSVIIPKFLKALGNPAPRIEESPMMAALISRMLSFKHSQIGAT